MTRESMRYDVVIVGAGPAGLATAIRLKQLKAELAVCVIDKGNEVGAHILSGAVLEPRALNELLPNWRELKAPISTEVIEDKFLWLTQRKAFRLPTPPLMRNHGNYIISLSEVCKWLGSIAENLGVEIYPGFAATELLVNTANQAYGVATGDKGIDKEGKPTQRYQAGIELHAKQVVLAEGCRGSVTKWTLQHYQLQDPHQPQTYGIGIKELWHVDSELHRPGSVWHSVGWPLDFKTYGGSFVYHLADSKVAVGFVIGLDYHNPYLDPFAEMQRFKTHPAIAPLFTGGKRLCYGARALSEGGLQAIPKLIFPGGLIVGDAAGFLNVPKIKGTHTAMKSGMLAAEAIITALEKNSDTASAYPELLKNSWLWPELSQVRNIRPAFHRGLLCGLAYSAVDSYLLRGRAPWTFSHVADHLALKPAAKAYKITYPKPDGKLTFDKLSSVYLSNTRHDENQPCHLQLVQPELAIKINLEIYAAPETRYCPANVYEIVDLKDGKPYLQINAANCVHCKTCDIKDPKQNINWLPPEGGDGPDYRGM